MTKACNIRITLIFQPVLITHKIYGNVTWCIHLIHSKFTSQYTTFCKGIGIITITEVHIQYIRLNREIKPLDLKYTPIGFDESLGFVTFLSESSIVYKPGLSNL